MSLRLGQPMRAHQEGDLQSGHAAVMARGFALCYDLGIRRVRMAIYPARFLRQQVPGHFV